MVLVIGLSFYMLKAKKQREDVFDELRRYAGILPPNHAPCDALLNELADGSPSKV